MLTNPISHLLSVGALSVIVKHQSSRRFVPSSSGAAPDQVPSLDDDSKMGAATTMGRVLLGILWQVAAWRDRYHMSRWSRLSRDHYRIGPGFTWNNNFNIDKVIPGLYTWRMMMMSECLRIATNTEKKWSTCWAWPRYVASSSMFCDGQISCVLSIIQMSKYFSKMYQESVPISPGSTMSKSI